MAYTIDCTPTAGGATIAYAVNAAASGKYARQFDAGAKATDLTRFRVPGTDGTLIVRSGNIGHRIIMTVRYIANTLDLLEDTITADFDNFADAAYNIEHGSVTYNGCNLVPGSVQKTSPVLPTGRAEDQVFVDVSCMFTEDQPL